jgi:hypothetical protein
VAEIGERLRIRFGLEKAPSKEQVTEWARLVRHLVVEGQRLDDAGTTAAKQTFPDFGKYVFKTEADTIVALLEAAEKK